MDLQWQSCLFVRAADVLPEHLTMALRNMLHVSHAANFRYVEGHVERHQVLALQAMPLSRNTIWRFFKGLWAGIGLCETTLLVSAGYAQQAAMRLNIDVTSSSNTAVFMPVPATPKQYAALRDAPAVMEADMSQHYAFARPPLQKDCWHSACKKPIAGRKGKCGRCMKASYCSKQCLLQDWPYHKHFCKTYITPAE